MSIRECVHVGQLNHPIRNLLFGHVTFVFYWRRVKSMYAVTFPLRVRLQTQNFQLSWDNIYQSKMIYKLFLIVSFHLPLIILLYKALWLNLNPPKIEIAFKRNRIYILMGLTFFVGKSLPFDLRDCIFWFELWFIVIYQLKHKQKSGSLLIKIHIP